MVYLFEFRHYLVPLIELEVSVTFVRASGKHSIGAV